MQRQNLLKIGFLTFIIGGLFLNPSFAQERASQMLNLFEGKDTEGAEGDELDFLLDELAEVSDFSLPTPVKKKNIKVNKKLQAEVLSLQDKLERANQKNASLKGDVKQLRGKLATRRQHLSKKAAAQIYEDLGTAYTQAKAYTKAIEAYVEALRFNPRSPKSHHDLGLLYEHSLGDSKKAVYHLRQYLKLGPGFEDSERVAHLIEIILCSIKILIFSPICYNVPFI